MHKERQPHIIDNNSSSSESSFVNKGHLMVAFSECYRALDYVTEDENNLYCLYNNMIVKDKLLGGSEKCRYWI